MLMSTLGISCTDEKMPSLEQKHAKSKVFVNSYTTDTFYSNLKDRLINITENNLIVDALCQGWTDKADLESLKNADQSTIELSISSFNFFPDMTFMRNIRNDFQKGKWTYKDTEKELLLEYEDADMGKDRYKIRAIASERTEFCDPSFFCIRW